MELDQEKLDEVVLALLFCNSWQEKIGPQTIARAWKSLDRDSLARLYQKDLISDPAGKAKSLYLTEEGRKLGRLLLAKHFEKR